MGRGSGVRGGPQNVDGFQTIAGYGEIEPHYCGDVRFNVLPLWHRQSCRREMWSGWRGRLLCCTKSNHNGIFTMNKIGSRE